MSLTVSQVARLTGLSVRALHHYDELGLLRPAGRSEAGYRLYSEDDLRRLQQVMFFRELDFPLEQIARILNDPGFDLGAALRLQRQLLSERAEHAQRLIVAVDAAIDSIEKGTPMNKQEMFEVFGDFDPSKHEPEVKERWGDTEAYKESARRTKRYGKKEWEQIKAEGAANLNAFAQALDAGRAPAETLVMDLAEQARLHIDRWFYPCSRAMHRGLGEMYVADARFTEHYERVRPGLARFVRDAIVANSERSS